MRQTLVVACTLALALVACGPAPGPGLKGDAASPPGADAQAGVDARASSPADAGLEPGADAASAAGPDGSSLGPDAGGTALTEQEPNDFKPSTQYNPVTLPLEMTGTLQSGTNPDMDVLGANLSAGDLWTWRLESPGGKVVPKLFIFEAAGDMPYFVSVAAQGQVAEQEQFALSSGLWHVVVADQRNPGDNNTVCGGATVCYGGADFDWKLTAQATARTPTAVVFPSTVQGTLRHAFALDLYGFHAAANTKIDVDLKAKRKSPPSNLESRMSLFDVTNKVWRITNDGQVQLATTDAHLSAPEGLPAEADYVIVVENTDPA
ncbi:MAG TPA: hypothetical protein VGK67_04310, partial [Myxococcales bacterium]